jgi:anti-anti-sigma regulatory factor
VTSVHAGRAPSAGSALNEVVDGQRGRVSVRGHLTRQGADLLRGTVDGLRRIGHSTVVLDLRGVQVADPIGLQMLHDLSVTMADAGDELRVLNAPDDESGRPDGLLGL